MSAEAIKSILGADAGVVALVGTRVRPGKLEQDENYPAIAFTRINENQDTILEHTWRGPYKVFFRFFCVARDYFQAKQVDDALFVALTGYSGTAAGVEIQAIFFANFARDGWDDETGTHQFIRDFTVCAVR